MFGLNIVQCLTHGRINASLINLTLRKNKSMDMKNWMGKLDDSKKATPIVHLAIPGSHDSMSYTISTKLEFSPGNDIPLEKIAKRVFNLFGGIGHKAIRKWSVTQDLPVLEQLNIGMRYLDFRVSTKGGDFTNIYFTHGLFGDNIKSHLKDIPKFLDQNKEEILIIDFQHLYDFNMMTHQMLIELLNQTFGNKLCPFVSDLETVTLKWMLSKGYRVIVIYRDAAIERKKIANLWPGPIWPTHWPHVSSVKSLIKVLNEKLAKRDKKKGLVTQCILTPDVSFVALHCLSSLKSSCAKPVMKDVIPWLKTQHPGPSGINIVISDFVNIDDAEFAKAVVNLNK